VTFDPASVCLGKKLGVVEDPRTFHLRTLLDTAALPSVPATWRYAGSLHEVPMFANDRYGCCTLASNGHRIVAQEFSTRQRDFPITDAEVLAAYSAVTGFDPRRPETDNGAYMLDVANYMRTVGLGREKDGSRHTVEAFVKIDHGNHAEVKAACNLFGGVWIGVWLPRSAQAQTGPNRAWDAPLDTAALVGDYEPGSWGGHAIEVVGYSARGLLAYTWSREQFMSWAFWGAYVDEAYAFIDEDWFRKGGTTPRGFRADQLRAWLSELG
jgi:hypothetical protein